MMEAIEVTGFWRRAMGWLAGLSLALASAAAPAEQARPGDDHQQALYLQMTRGDLPAALDAYVRALQSAEGEATDRVLLDQASCLEWSGDQLRQKGVLSILQARDEGPEGLGPLPAESDLVFRLDLDALDKAPFLDRLRLKIDPTLWKRFLGPAATDRGLTTSRLSLALSLGGDERAPVDHWVARLDGNFDALDPEGLDRLVKQLAIEIARSQAGINVQVEAEPGAESVVNIESACCPGEAPSASLDRMQRYGHRVHMARVRVPGTDRGVVEVGAARLGAASLVIGEGRALERTLAAGSRATAGLRANRRLWRMAAQVPEGEAVWLVMSPDEILRQVRKVQAILGWGGSLPEVTGLTVSGRWGDSLDLSATARTSHAEAARALADLAKGGLALFRLASVSEAAGEPAIQAVADGLKIEVDGRFVRVNLSLPRAAFKPAPAARSARILHMTTADRVRLALEQVVSVEVSDPDVVRATVEDDGLVLKAERPGRTVLRVVRADRPVQQFEVEVTAPASP